VTCGRWDTTRPREVCSPWHAVTNGTFVATGLLVAAGVLLTWSVLGHGVATRTAQLLTLGAGTGWVLAGVYPADVNENNHFLATLLIVVGNLGMIAAALARQPSLLGSMRPFSLVLGAIGITGTVLFFNQVDLGFGVGGLERVAIFPSLVWTTVVAGRSFSPPSGLRPVEKPVIAATYRYE
jgi:hypothetical membrane protein